jgi:hypothetical protein
MISFSAFWKSTLVKLTVSFGRFCRTCETLLRKKGHFLCAQSLHTRKGNELSAYQIVRFVINHEALPMAVFGGQQKYLRDYIIFAKRTQSGNRPYIHT